MTHIKNIFWNGTERRLRAGWRLAIQFAIMMFFLVVFAFIDMFFGHSLPRSPLGTGDSILLPVEMLAAALLSVWLAGRFIDRRRFADFGFRFGSSWWADLGFGLVLGVLLTGGIFLIELGAGWVTVVDTFRSGGYGLAFPVDILLGLGALIGVGIYEELFTRGYHLKNLSEGFNLKAIGPRRAVILAGALTSVAFGVMHATNPNASVTSTVGLMIAGVLYAAAYALTGELAIPIGYHIAWNFFEGSVFGFAVSGSSLGATFIAIRQGGPDLWTGSAFGPEAGLLGIGARLVGILLIVAWVRLRRGKAAIREQIAIPDLLSTRK